MDLEYIQSRDIRDFQPLIDALKSDLGDRFPISMENWCGIGQRPYPLPCWQVFIGRDKATGETVGLCSYYQQENEPSDKYWVGWIGTVPSFRRQGIATLFLNQIKKQVISNNGKSLWVHTDSDNVSAISFYKAYGFSEWGQFKDTDVDQASADDDSVVFLMNI